MDTKEAINWIKHITDCFKCIGDFRCSEIDKGKNEVIELLERGEKYGQMWGKFNEIEQKFFKDVTIEIEAKNIKDMANSLRDIGNFVNIIGATKMKVIDIGKFKKGGK